MNIVTCHGLLDSKEVYGTFHVFDDGCVVWHGVWAHPDLRYKGRYLDVLRAIAPEFNKLLGQNLYCVGARAPTRKTAAQVNEEHGADMSEILQRRIIVGEYKNAAYYFAPALTDNAEYSELPEWAPLRCLACRG